MCLGSHLKWCDCTRARVGEEYIDVTMFLFHDGIKPVQIFQARHVAHDHRNVSLDEGSSLLQLFLPSPSDHDVRTFFHEALGGAQANPAASACDNRNFSRQFLSMVITHMFFPFFVFSLFTTPYGLRISNGVTGRAWRVRVAQGRRRRRPRWRS